MALTCATVSTRGGAKCHHAAAAAATIYPSLSNASEPAPVLADKPRLGQLGMKSGQGFYAWPPERIQAERERYSRVLRAGLQILADDLPPIEP